MSIERAEIERAELQLDIYGGEDCDQHHKRWVVEVDGDIGQDILDTDETLDFETCKYPPGTRITVEVPVCPTEDCDELRTHDEDECVGCGFDWKEWDEDRYQ